MKTIKRITTAAVVLFFVSGITWNGEPSRAAESTNVIVVMADDMGLGDLSATNPNCKIKTPHLQRMADEGLTFLDAHTPSAVCTPTRYGLMTGRYNWRSRLAQGVLSGTSEHLIPADRPTVGHLMRAAGYHTAMIGKWHLGWDWYKVDGKIDFTKPVLNGPNINGFDRYYAHCGSLDMPPYVWVDTGQITAVPDRARARSAPTLRSTKFCRTCSTNRSHISRTVRKTVSHFSCTWRCPHPTHRLFPWRRSKVPAA
jgi:arylsulfatase A